MPFVNGQWQNPTTAVSGLSSLWQGQDALSPNAVIGGNQLNIGGGGGGGTAAPTSGTGTNQSPLSAILARIMQNYGMPSTNASTGQPTAGGGGGGGGITLPNILQGTAAGKADVAYYNKLAGLEALTPHAQSASEIAGGAAQQDAFTALQNILKTPGGVLTPGELGGISPGTIATGPGGQGLKGNVNPYTGQSVGSGGVSARDWALAQEQGTLPEFLQSYQASNPYAGMSAHDLSLMAGMSPGGAAYIQSQAAPATPATKTIMLGNMPFQVAQGYGGWG